jgi:hypothetical protein
VKCSENNWTYFFVGRLEELLEYGGVEELSDVFFEHGCEETVYTRI